MIAQTMPVGGLSLVTKSDTNKNVITNAGTKHKTKNKTKYENKNQIQTKNQTNSFTIALTAMLMFLVAAPAYAGTGLGDFFSWFTGWAEDVHHAFTNDVPSMFERMYAWLVYWVTYMKITLMISSIEFSWGVAKVILDDFGWTAIINNLLTSLPPDTQALISALKLPTAFEWVLTAYITRFVRSAI